MAVVLEQARGRVLYALMDHDFLILSGQSRIAGEYRKAFFSSRAKSDPCDAKLLQEMVRRIRSTCAPGSPTMPIPGRCGC